MNTNTMELNMNEMEMVNGGDIISGIGKGAITGAAGGVVGGILGGAMAD